MRDGVFDRLPRPTALLLLAALLKSTSGHVLQQIPSQTPGPTITVPYRALNVVSWPPRPTPAPRHPFALRRQAENTVCGYIGGDEALPATCGAGSHCVLDTQHNVVGCCPNGAPSCTNGVFTGCVDANSGPQTEVNPYVFSCTGANVCYRNVFDGGFSQFGCGTASDLGGTVRITASGITALTHPVVSVSYTQGISTLTEPTTLGTITGKSTTTRSTRAFSSSSSALSSSIFSSPTTEANPAATTTLTASAATDSTYKTGAIVGGTIGGLAVLVALAALAFFLIRRRNANVRQGPGPGGVRGMVISPPTPSGGTGFAALPQDSDAFETGPANSVLNQPPMAMTANRGSLLTPLAAASHMPTQHEISPLDNDAHSMAYGGGASVSNGGLISSASASSNDISSTAAATTDSNNTYRSQSQFQNQYPTAYPGGAGLAMGPGMMHHHDGGERSDDSDQVPLTREIDDFSQGFNAALGKIGEEEEEALYDEHGHDRNHQGQEGEMEAALAAEPEAQSEFDVDVRS
ncbi:hypothetical protein N0V88_006935 [Collariella sp. IMI 366227]|nr:hypothetical protein N0V88_006935 [Collariella sp. IMI 366227]